MIYVIMSSDVQRNQGERIWISKAVIYIFSAASLSTIAGAALGALGSLVGLSARAWLAVGFGAVAIIIGLVELLGRQLQPLQRTRETPQSWLSLGSWRAAALHGGSLGLGATTRIGFWLWYVVPVGAFVSGEAIMGALIFGVYGGTRGASLVPLALSARRLGQASVGRRLLVRAGSVRRLCGAMLAIVGIALVVGVG